MLYLNNLPTLITVNTEVPKQPKMTICPSKRELTQKLAEIDQQIESNDIKCQEIRSHRNEYYTHKKSEYDHWTEEFNSNTLRLAEQEKGKMMYGFKMSDEDLEELTRKIRMLILRVADLNQKFLEYNQEEDRLNDSGLFEEGFDLASSFNKQIKEQKDVNLELSAQKKTLELEFDQKLRIYVNTCEYIKRIESIEAQKEALLNEIKNEEQILQKKDKEFNQKIEQEQLVHKQNWARFSEQKPFKEKVDKVKDDQEAGYLAFKNLLGQTELKMDTCTGQTTLAPAQNDNCAKSVRTFTSEQSPKAGTRSIRDANHAKFRVNDNYQSQKLLNKSSQVTDKLAQFVIKISQPADIMKCEMLSCCDDKSDSNTVKDSHLPPKSKNFLEKKTTRSAIDPKEAKNYIEDQKFERIVSKSFQKMLEGLEGSMEVNIDNKSPRKKYDTLTSLPDTVGDKRKDISAQFNIVVKSPENSPIKKKNSHEVKSHVSLEFDKHDKPEHQFQFPENPKSRFQKSKSNRNLISIGKADKASNDDDNKSIKTQKSGKYHHSKKKISIAKLTKNLDMQKTFGSEPLALDYDLTKRRKSSHLKSPGLVKRKDQSTNITQKLTPNDTDHKQIIIPMTNKLKFSNNK